MLVWVLIFLIVVIAAFFLALASMRDYREDQALFWSTSSLYLVQQPQNLNEDFLNKVSEYATSANASFSFERLSKGIKEALVIFGPVTFLQDHIHNLGLLELVDYSDKQSLKTEFSFEYAGWEIVSADNLSTFSFKNLKPTLGEDEQFWWQVIVKSKDQKSGLMEVVVRLVLLTVNPQRLSELGSQILAAAKHQNLIVSTKPSTQTVSKYKDREFYSSFLAKFLKMSRLEKNKLNLTEIDILKLIKG